MRVDARGRLGQPDAPARLLKQHGEQRRRNRLKPVLGMAIGALALGLVAAAPSSTAAQDKSLWDVVAMLQTKKFVDLTHAFDRNIPH